MEWRGLDVIQRKEQYKNIKMWFTSVVKKTEQVQEEPIVSIEISLKN